jgi:hypothetical protein
VEVASVALVVARAASTDPNSPLATSSPNQFPVKGADGKIWNFTWPCKGGMR